MTSSRRVFKASGVVIKPLKTVISKEPASSTRTKPADSAVVAIAFQTTIPSP
ncbi:hypothetical protein EVA_15804 [gut metagenome]|uniref:Uncharacterized protein n=1 Tax=gut metagenome TaxID=749906 RepID=J9G9I7_9ZZZZ